MPGNVLKRRSRTVPALVTLLVTLLPTGCGEEDSPPETATSRIDGAVAASTPEAAEVGRDILSRGGNAVDAAVAVSLAMAVTDPGQAGIGGTGVAVLRMPGGEGLVLWNPEIALAGPEGGERVLVPALPALLQGLFEEHGSGALTWEDIVAPARSLAADGYVLGRYAHRTLVREYRLLLERPATTVLVVGSDSAGLPAEGTLMRSPALASTLEALGRDGTAALYGGALGQRLTTALGEIGVEMGPGQLDRATEVRTAAPLSAGYRGATVLAPPEPFGGPELLRALTLMRSAPPGMLEDDPGPGMGVWIAEALLYAFLAGADESPGGYLSRRAALPTESFAADTAAGPGDHETAHLSVVDGDGMAVALTQTLGGPYGSMIAAGDLGFVLARPAPTDTYGGILPGAVKVGFAAETGGTGRAGETGGGGAVDAVDVGDVGEGGEGEGTGEVAGAAGGSGGGKRWLVPAVVVHPEDSSVVALGSPGGRPGVAAVAQVIVRWVRQPDDLRSAVGGSRIHAGPSPAGTGEGARIYLEGREVESRDTTITYRSGPWGDALPAILADRGLTVSERDDGLLFDDRAPWFGGVNAAGRTGEGWQAAADPRRDGGGQVVGEAVPTPTGGPARAPSDEGGVSEPDTGVGDGADTSGSGEGGEGEGGSGGDGPGPASPAPVTDPGGRGG